MDESGLQTAGDGTWTTLCLSVAGVRPAHRVAVVGDFTAWAPVDMSFDGRRFSIHVILPRHRRWRYRFRLDDDLWMNDPDADDLELCADGFETSIRLT
jgi:hypothetical protein